MNPSPLEYSESLHVGVVEYISPDEIKVLLDIEAPDSVALNTGTPRPFPRVNSYVLITSDDGYLVGQVEWLTVERSNYPKRRGMQDFGLIDLPYPLRKMSLNPLGTLQRSVNKEGTDTYRFKRGSDSFPSVGDRVLLPTQHQLRSIVESGENRRVKIGTSPLAGNADVSVDPNRLFGRHLAVLGNTGSGKSCTVAGLIRWSLEAAKQQTVTPNARFIVLDPNGEYARAFSDENDIKARIYTLNPESGKKQLHVPLWFWNSSEWSSFAQATGKTQRPLLRRALREVKEGRENIIEMDDIDRKLLLRRYVSSNVIYIQRELQNGSIRFDESKFGFRLKAIYKDYEDKINKFPEFKTRIEAIKDYIKTALTSTYNEFIDDNGKKVKYYRAFDEAQIKEILDSMVILLDELGGIVYHDGPSEDIPISFSGSDFVDHLQIIAEQEGITQYIDFLVMRIRSILSDNNIKPIISDTDDITLDQWLIDYIGENKANNGNITIIDLSLVPSEIIHVVTSVISRVIFESLQRYRNRQTEHKVLPTTIIMEEAHTFIKRYKDETENQDTASICCKVFERIAREGRKFGLGLVLSSQRPSELSPTVLSQCNTFLIHRLSNDRDQDLVNRFVPDNLRGLLRELPSLPSQNAIFLGWASELPILVRMNDLPKGQQPQSEDPDFWEVWTNQENREVNWKEITDDWQGKQENNSNNEDQDSQESDSNTTTK
ncbi:MAG: ATP-binding protein [Balneolales bacterium]